MLYRSRLGGLEGTEMIPYFSLQGCRCFPRVGERRNSEGDVVGVEQDIYRKSRNELHYRRAVYSSRARKQEQEQYESGSAPWDRSSSSNALEVSSNHQYYITLHCRVAKNKSCHTANKKAGCYSRGSFILVATLQTRIYHNSHDAQQHPRRHIQSRHRQL